MAKAKTFIIPNARHASFLIGDSEKHGKDQQISDIIKYNKDGLFDAHNERVISEAREMVRRDGYTNIRMVTIWDDAICIYCGIIGYKRRRETIKPFKF